jgi:hypothetical protein
MMYGNGAWKVFAEIRKEHQEKNGPVTMGKVAVRKEI